MLFHLSTSGKSAVERERAVADLGGRSRLLRSYLTRTVLDELDPERREFLLATSTLGTLTGPLCDALLRREGSAAVLEDLASRQFFTTLGRERSLLPVPPGAADPARGPARRRARTPGGGAALRPRRQAARGGRTAAGGAAGLRDGRGLRFRGAGGRAVERRAGDGAAPGRSVDHAGDDPWLALVRARRLQREGAFEAAVAAFRDAEALLEDSEFRRRCGEERAAARDVAGGRDGPGPAGRGPGDPTGRGPGGARRDSPAPAARPAAGAPLAAGVVLLLAGEAVRGRPQAGARRGRLDPEQLFADLARVVAEIVAVATATPSRPWSRSCSPPRSRSSPGSRGPPAASRPPCCS